MNHPSAKNFLLYESVNVKDPSSAHEKVLLLKRFDTPEKIKYGIPAFLCGVDTTINIQCQLFLVPELNRYVIRYTPSIDGYRSIAEVFADGSVCTRYTMKPGNGRWSFEQTAPTLRP